MKRVRVCVILFLFCLVPGIVLANQSVRINEFLVDGTEQSIELVNTATESADISGWYLDDSGGSTYFTVPSQTIIYPGSCTVFSSDFNLNKSTADVVRLFSSLSPPTEITSLLIDSYAYKKSPGQNVSFMRMPDGKDTWATGPATLGLFNESGLPCVPTPTSTPAPTLIPTSNQTTVSPTPIPQPTDQNAQLQRSYDKVFISEVEPYPLPDEHEWVELYNDNDFAVSLIDWYIDDSENTGSAPKKFTLTIEPKAYAVFETTSSLFNNDKDQVRLMDYEKKEKDSMEYGRALPGKTFGRTSFDSDLFCTQDPSKGEKNTSCLTITTDTTNTPSPHILYPPIISPIQQPMAVPENNIYTPIIKHGVFTSSPAILGLSTFHRDTSSSNLTLRQMIPLFSTLSFSYSVLTICLILIRIKHAS